MKLVLKNVRCSFPALFETETYDGNDTGKYACTFLIEKSDPQVKKIKAAMKEVAEEKLGKPLPKGIKPSFHDGDEKEQDGYEGCFYIKASTKRRPVVVDLDKTPVTEDDDRVYAGCYVNVSMDLWCQNNAYGKAVRFALNGVQFSKDGERFGSANTAMDDFEAVELTESEEEVAEADPFA